MLRSEFKRLLDEEKIVWLDGNFQEYQTYFVLSVDKPKKVLKVTYKLEPYDIDEMDWDEYFEEQLKGGKK